MLFLEGSGEPRMGAGRCPMNGVTFVGGRVFGCAELGGFGAGRIDPGCAFIGICCCCLVEYCSD